MNKEELSKIATQMVAKPRGILAIDESLPTIGKRFKEYGLENTEENRQAYRQLLITTEGLGKYISGAILFEETLFQKTDEGTDFVDALKKHGVLPGIKVDKGAVPMEGSPNEKVTNGLEGLDERLAKYREQGAAFAKWRAVITIGDGIPTDACIEVNTERLAEYARLCQKNDIVPIVEPEVVMNGDHTIERDAEVTSRTLKVLFSKLEEKGVYLPGVVLKPNMIAAGEDAPKSSVEEVAQKTVEVLKGAVPTEVAGIAFLSGGIGDEDVTLYLNAVNKASGLPWNLTFSFGRGLQRDALARFAEGKIAEGQKALLERSEASSQATEGKYA